MPRYSFASILTETSSNLSAETNIYKNTTNITVFQDQVQEAVTSSPTIQLEDSFRCARQQGRRG